MSNTPKTVMTGLHGSIFHLEDAKRRSGLKNDPAIEDDNSEDKLVRRGRQDRDKWIIATTHFHTMLPGKIRVCGGMELGVTKEALQKAVMAWEAQPKPPLSKPGERQEHRKPVAIQGPFQINDIPCEGELFVSFSDRDQTSFSYVAFS